MSVLSIYCERLDEPARATALPAMLLAEARARSCAILCTYQVPGDVVALGRYHVVPASTAGGVALVRRHGGGRPAPLGGGFLGVALGLPNRSALLPAAAALSPSQILNRYVRGFLGALESLGVAGYYPGRDVVTVDGRVVAGLGFEIAADGATLLEMCVAVSRSFAELSVFVDRADPAGVVPLDVVLPEQATSISEVTGRVPDLDELAAAVASGYASRLGCDVVVAEPLPPPEPDHDWLAAGRLAPHLDRHAIARDLLGVVEAYVACRAERVHDVRLCGDFLAPSPTVARLEAALRGAPVERDVLRHRVVGSLTGPDDVLLGIRAPSTIGDLVLGACRA
jgi:lipoate-protein ligase A